MTSFVILLIALAIFPVFGHSNLAGKNLEREDRSLRSRYPGGYCMRGAPGRDGRDGLPGQSGTSLQGPPGSPGAKGETGPPGSRPTIPQVAFSVAWLAADPHRQGPFHNSRPIIFNHFATNIGGGFDTKTSIFTCPVAGLYHFSFSANAPPGRHANVRVMRNNVVVTYSYSGHQYVPASGTATLLLKVGDKVWLQLYKGSAIWRVDNSFSGFLFNAI